MRNILAACVFLVSIGCGNSGACGNSAGCPAGFDLDEVFYGMGCTAVAPQFVSDVSLGSPVTTNGVAADVREVEGVPTDVLVAVEAPIDCGTAIRVNGEAWVAAFPLDSPKAEAGEAICRVGDLSASQRAANDCD